MPDRTMKTTQSLNTDDTVSTTSDCHTDKHSEDSVGIHTSKIYDQCRDKDCLEDLRVYFTPSTQQLIDNAINVKIKKAEVLWVFTDIEPLAFNKGYYSVDLKYFFKLSFDVFTGLNCPKKAEGLATFDKRVVLYGSEGNCKIFSSNYSCDHFDPQSFEKSNLPQAIVEVVDPIALSCQLVEVKDDCKCSCENETVETHPIPQNICEIFGDNFVIRGEEKKVYVSLGVFSIIKLERKVQLLVPSFDFYVPDKECVASTDENPCDLFSKINFPMDQFFPPNNHDKKCGC